MVLRVLGVRISVHLRNGLSVLRRLTSVEREDKKGFERFSQMMLGRADLC